MIKNYRPYLIAAVLAFLMTVFIAPEMHEGDAMSPMIKSGDVLVLYKQTYSQNRGMPEKGDIVVLEKGAFGDDYEEDSPIRIVTGLPGDKVKMEDGTFVKIKKNYVFVSCKNIEDGLDSSKMDIGPIKSKAIRGEVILRLWPFNSIGGLK